MGVWVRVRGDSGAVPTDLSQEAAHTLQGRAQLFAKPGVEGGYPQRDLILRGHLGLGGGGHPLRSRRLGISAAVDERAFQRSILLASSSARAAMGKHAMMHKKGYARRGAQHGSKAEQRATAAACSLLAPPASASAARARRGPRPSRAPSQRRPRARSASAGVRRRRRGRGLRRLKGPVWMQWGHCFLVLFAGLTGASVQRIEALP